jgi:hypothetical protein
LIIFDGRSNVNEIIENLTGFQSISKIIYLFFFFRIFLFFLELIIKSYSSPKITADLEPLPWMEGLLAFYINKPWNKKIETKL